jgi:hypothetical protein
VKELNLLHVDLGQEMMLLVVDDGYGEEKKEEAELMLFVLGVRERVEECVLCSDT